MTRNHDDKRICPLFNREILYGECYEVQEVRGDEMEMALALEPFDLEKANEICEKCRWYVVTDCMASDLSPEDRAFFEAVLARAEPYPEDDPIWEVWDGERDHDRAMATIAKMALEGRLR